MQLASLLSDYPVGCEPDLPTEIVVERYRQLEKRALERSKLTEYDLWQTKLGRINSENVISIINRIYDRHLISGEKRKASKLGFHLSVCELYIPRLNNIAVEISLAQGSTDAINLCDKKLHAKSPSAICYIKSIQSICFEGALRAMKNLRINRYNILFNKAKEDFDCENYWIWTNNYRNLQNFIYDIQGMVADIE
jgi:hypothetical protein